MNNQSASYVVRMVANWLLWRRVESEPLPDYSKSTTFSGRGGAWFMIVVSLFCMAVFVIVMVSSYGWYLLFFILLALFSMLMLRRGVIMLADKIHVGPEKLVLDGAWQKPNPTGFIYWFKLELLLITPLVVEIPWEDVLSIYVDDFELNVETRSHQHFIIPIGHFNTHLLPEISKYHKIDTGNDTFQNTINKIHLIWNKNQY